MPVDDDTLVKIEYYRKTVMDYERLNEKIQELLESHSGSTENMTDIEVQQYRTLARQRDEALNEMRLLEQQLLDE